MHTSTRYRLSLRAAWPLAVLGFIAGCTAVQFRATLPSVAVLEPWLYGAVAFMILTLVVLTQCYTKMVSQASTLVLLVLAGISGLALGIAWAAYMGAVRVADGWPAAHEGVDIVATGYVATMPTFGGQGWAAQRVLYVIESNETDPLLNGKTVSLGWYSGSFALQAAQRYRITFRAKQRRGGLNPGGFDYELWLVSRGIAATGYVRTVPLDLAAQVSVVSGTLAWVERARGHIRSRLFAASAGSPEAARWAAALALGDQRSLSDADWQRYNATGTGHLLAVSGTHITLMGALLAWLAGRWWRASPARLLRLPLQTLRLNVMLISAAAYGLIAGWALPAQRTVLMLAVVWWSLRIMARPAVWHVMASSAAVALALDPMAVIAPSFWLSYGAVAVLIAVELQPKSRLTDTVLPALTAAQTVAPRWAALWQSFREAARSQLLLTLALVPLGAVFFNQLSLVSPLANAVAIPVMGWLSTPLALVAAGLSLVWGSMAGALMQVLLAVQLGMDAVLDALLRLPHAQLRVPTAPTAWAVFGMVCAVGCAFAQRRWRAFSVLGVGVYVGGAFTFTMQATEATQAGQANRPPKWRVAFLDVGQGMAVAVHSQGKTLLFDAGPRYSADSDGAARVIVPYLQAAGVTQLDHVVLSHADDDHTGGARSLLARMPVAQWWHSLSPAHPLLAALPANPKPCEAGKRLDWAGLQLHWLHPPAGVNHDDHKTNAVSCVLRISDGKTAVLLTGDIEAQQEQSLIVRNTRQDGQGDTDLRAQILLAAHHGSKTSSSAAFLQAVAPQHVVIQNGYRNRYGHPHPSVSDRFAQAGITQWRSDVDGAVLLDVQFDGFKMTAWRSQAQRYWHTVLPAAASLRGAVDGREF